MYPLDEFRSCLERTACMLAACQVRFHLTGGAAAIAYGDPRTTQDIDLVVDAEALRERLETFFDLLNGEQFLYHEGTIRDAVRSGGVRQESR